MKSVLVAVLASLLLAATASAQSPRVDIVSRTANIPKAKVAHTNALSVQEYLNRSVGLADQYLCGKLTPGWQCWSIDAAWVVNWQPHGPHVAVRWTERTLSAPPGSNQRYCIGNIYWSHTSYFNYGNTCSLPF
jgi:hypothetical protein